MTVRGWVLTVGVLFHLIYLRSIFDIYFKSPVVSVNDQYYPVLDANEHIQPPTERTFLIVGDGLRADKLFENPQLAPFLHQKAFNNGRWGISHTRVPTESRPGHVAMIAGLYEDVSAVTTGWTVNPINFDSTFNQSSRTYAWGSPDILPMFREGASDKSKIDCSMYDSAAEDFTDDSYKLDNWVFDHVQELLASASHNSTLSQELKAPKTVFFLHLLGIDTAGHSHRPYSKEYMHNIEVVDRGIAELMYTLENTWSTEELSKTTFLFTADHGMSDWGSHGDGHPDNTRTPYIVWGAGIKKPAVRSATNLSQSLLRHGTQDESLSWQVANKDRVDVAQADLAALMTYLIGVPFPKNNVGSIPVDILDATPDALAIATFQNARQIHAQYASKALHKSNQLHFSKLIEHSFSEPFENNGLKLIREKRWSEVEKLSADWILQSLEGMKYFQRYDWLFLRTIVTLGYFGWMLFALTFVLKTYVLPYTSEEQIKLKDSKIEGLMGPKLDKDSTRTSSATKAGGSHHHIVELTFFGLTIALAAFLVERSAPISYYAYVSFPLYFWFGVLSDLPALLRQLKIFSAHSGQSVLKSVGIAILGLITLQSIVYAYAERRIFSVLWIAAAFTPIFYPAQGDKRNSVIWSALCTLMSVFTSLPTVQVQDSRLVVFGGCAMCAIGLYFILTKGGNFTMGAQLGLVALTTLVTRESCTSLENKQGLPFRYQCLGWVALVSSLVLPLCHRFERSANEKVSYQHRLIILYLTFAPTFIILSISYEGIFYITFWALLVTWLHLEAEISDSLGHNSNIATIKLHPNDVLHRGVQHSDARVALYFFFLIQAAFFGTGNIASVSSFSLDSVYRLIPVFDPFAMGLLLMFKLLVPFAVISANLGILNRRLRVRPSAIFMMVLCFCDLVTLNFFWMVKDEGSWLEIGSSISAFVIGGLLILFVICLEQVSELMIGDVEI